MTPSERAAVGLTDQQRVHLLVRTADGSWTVQREWDAQRFSHTDFMLAARDRAEPANPEQLLDWLPPDLR
ncbi:MAG TPA: hypothetical protein VMW17_02370 [Candidatus Binatia bacterium]|nr:hypothetical protein [Candidatus Binatia bacterium]